MDRTITVHLSPTPEQARLLKSTLEQHTACFNEVAREGFTTQCSNGVELHKRTYYPLRAHYPDLPAQLVCAARVRATESVKSALTWAKKKEAAFPKRVAKALKRGKPAPLFKPVKMPHSVLACIRYDARSSWVKWASLTCSLATSGGRVELPFTVPLHALRYVGNQVCSADLCYRKGRYRLHIVVSLPEPVVTPSDGVIGVDLGLNRPAVTSTPAGATIVFENLTNIRETSNLGRNQLDTKRRLHGWSYAQLYSFTLYKAQERGIRVERIDPRHTSQTCSRCGYQLNADLNASYNIRSKYLASIGLSLAGGLPSVSLSSQSSD